MSGSTYNAIMVIGWIVVIVTFIVLLGSYNESIQDQVRMEVLRNRVRTLELAQDDLCESYNKYRTNNVWMEDYCSRQAANRKQENAP